MANGFSISEERIRVDGYRQHRLHKDDDKHRITISTLNISGVLTVKEPDVFTEKCLFRGIGPAKSFGCGLMLVKRV